MKKPDSSANLYEILEVSPRARPEIVQAAYRALMKIYHPDNGNSDGAMVRSINEAHAILGDPRKRKEYDGPAAELQPGAIIGEYRIEKMIAEGGFGKTFLATHLVLGESVCIKDCSNIAPEYAGILLEEAKAVWDMRHFSLPAMRGLLKISGGGFALVMSYIPGQTLSQIIEKVGRLDPEHVAWIAERVLNALKYLHFHGVIHGDIKPQNIIIQSDSHTVVLVDFGLSLVKPSCHSASKGFTECFAPPEEIAGSTLLPGSDFYSFGMTMLYALGGGVESVRRKQVPRDVPDALCSFIKRLIVHDVASRPQWKKEDLFETIQEVRKQAFGRSRSNMKPIPGI